MSSWSPPPVKAGKLRQYASIEQKVSSGTGDRGQPVTTWQALAANVPMEILPVAGRLLEISRQLCSTATHQITLRYRAGILAGMRVTYQGRHFNIGFSDEGDQRKRWLVLQTTEQRTGAT